MLVVRDAFIVDRDALTLGQRDRGLSPRLALGHVQEQLAMAGRGFGVLIDRNDDRLHARTAPVFSRDGAFVQAPLGTARDLSRRLTWLLLLDAIALGAEVVDLVEHPLKQCLGRGAG